VLAAPYARLAGVPLGLWYTHRSADWRLRLAHPLVDVVLTASKESFRLPSRKVRVLGHGIDTGTFSPGDAPAQPPLVLSAGRISPAKGHHVALDAAARLLGRSGASLRVQIAGDLHVPSDAAYRQQLCEQAARPPLDGRVDWLGAVPYGQMPALYRSAAAFVNCSDTGSLDKTVLEAMACATPVLVSNEAFRELLTERHLGPLPATLDGALTFPRGNAAALAQKLAAVLALAPDERAALGQALRRVVVSEHDLDVLAQRIVQALQ
jgi:glycosyltransferase involved in cell wall biosynthesis